MNPVLLFFYNTTAAQLKLVELCVESIFTQTIPVHLVIIDNGSTERETYRWISTLSAPAPHTIEIRKHAINTAPTKIVNQECGSLFAKGAQYVLGVPSDAILPPYCYERLLGASTRGFISAYMHSPEPPQVPASLSDLNFQIEAPLVNVLHSDMHTALMLIRKWAYDALVEQDGYFLDEGMFLYACDIDLKMRLEKIGITGAQTDLSVYHYSSACWRLGTPEVARSINAQADRDRDYFFNKWGVKL